MSMSFTYIRDLTLPKDPAKFLMRETEDCFVLLEKFLTNLTALVWRGVTARGKLNRLVSPTGYVVSYTARNT